VTGGGDRPLPRATLPELFRRAVAAARSAADAPEDRVFARAVLTPAELELWSRQSALDRAHSVRVARRVERRLAETVHGSDSRWTAAALLHDVGKTDSGLAPLERAVATLASRVVDSGRARRWASRGAGFRRRIGSYLLHGEIGARMIRSAGGRAEAAAWAEVHQGDRGGPGPGIPSAVAAALVESDVA
jgi:HD domain